MAPSKSTQERRGTGQRIAGWLKRIPGGALVFAVVPLIVFGYVGWYYYGAKQLDEALYGLRLEQLEVTDPPEWVKSDVKQEVFTNSRLDRLSTLDAIANSMIAQAFETHAWVRSVQRVSKSAGGSVLVDLTYRRPIAMVYCESATELRTDDSSRSSERGGFYPVDAHGIVLPVTSFEQEDIWDYMLIIAAQPQTAGDAGMSFGDSRIDEALKLVEILLPHRESLKLEMLYVEHNAAAKSHPVMLNLSTADKLYIRWGHAPGHEAENEPPPKIKLQHLVAWLRQVRSGTRHASELDLQLPAFDNQLSSQ